MPPKGKASGKSGGSKGKGAEGDAESSSSGKQTKGGTAVKVLFMLKLFLFGKCVIDAYCQTAL